METLFLRHGIHVCQTATLALQLAWLRGLIDPMSAFEEWFSNNYTQRYWRERVPIGLVIFGPSELSMDYMKHFTILRMSSRVIISSRINECFCPYP